MHDPTLFTDLTQEELNTLSLKMQRVINDPKVPDYAWRDAEDVYRDIVCEAMRRWNNDRWI